MSELFAAQLREHGVERSAATILSALEAISAQPEHGFVLAAMNDGTPVGVAYAVCILSLEHGGWSGWLEELYVVPEWRGCGVGSELLSAVVAAADARDWMALDLEVDAGHQRVIPLYARHGFEPVPRSRFVRRRPREAATP